MAVFSARTSLAALCLAILAFFAAGGEAKSPAPTIVFGGDLNYPPYEWREKSKAKGFLIDVEDALGRAGGGVVKHRLASWPQTISALKAGDVDVVPMFISDERQESFWFSRPLFFAHHAIFTAADPGAVTDASQLYSWRVAVEDSSFAHERLKDAQLKRPLVLTGNTEEALLALAEDRADYAVLAEGPAARLISADDLSLSRVGAPFWPREYAFAVRRDRTEMIAWVEQNLDKVIATGEFQRIQAHWQHALNGPPDTASQKAIESWKLIAGAAFALLFLVLTLSVRAFNKERSRRATAEQEAIYLAGYDSASGLPRRRGFELEIDRLLASAGTRQLKLIVIRADAIRQGERKLSPGQSAHAQFVIGSSLREIAYVSGFLCDRTFAALIPPDTARETMQLLVEKLKEEGFDAEFVGGGAKFPDDGEDASTLLSRAELAQTTCFDSGHRFAVFEPHMEDDQSRGNLVKDFLSFGKDEIYAVYQPQMDLNSGRITAAEALARWDHAELGPIAPDHFIPRLERAGLIGDLTLKMISEAVKESVRFREGGSPLRISVNVSAQDFADRNLPQIVAEALREFGGNPEDLTLELTESGAVQDTTIVKEALEQLSRLGVRTAIDDFGTGFASLASLTQLPFRELKIDRLFVEQMLTSAGHREAVMSAVNMARRMDMEVVAEGAPDFATIQLLRQMRCTRVQSFAISPPLSSSELHRFVSDFAFKQNRPENRALKVVRRKRR